MEKIFTDSFINEIFEKLSASEPKKAKKQLPPQPIHTFYGGAHLFRFNTAKKMGELALRGLTSYAKNGDELLRVFAADTGVLPASDTRSQHEKALFAKIHSRLVSKLQTEPVEDYRVDFEDGYGVRSNEEEDDEAVRVAKETAKALEENQLPELFGLRIKALNKTYLKRSLRTLEIYISSLLENSNGRMPRYFIVTAPKIESPVEAKILNRALTEIEQKFNLPANSVYADLMIESPSAVISGGKLNIGNIIDAAGERCLAINIGIYDFTSMLGVAAQSQEYKHPFAGLLRLLLKMEIVQKRIYLSDGATHILPVEIYGKEKDSAHPNDALRSANRDAIHKAWRLAYNNNLHSLYYGIYQGWDLHPYQLIPRYVALYKYFLNDLSNSIERMKNFLGSDTNQSLTSHFFDDAASALGLYNYFVKAASCGAITDDDIKPLGLTCNDFVKKTLREMITE